MASIFDFLGFGKKQKVSQTQAFRELPSAESAPLFGTLKDYAQKRISGVGTGFGDEFTDKVSGPVATRMRNDFSSYTAPRLSSQASSRGLGRSTLALDIDRRANQENESNIDQLYADLYKLNEMQKKTDEQFGVNVGQNLDTQYLNQANQAAEAFNTAERGNTERTAGVAAKNNANSLSRQNQFLQAVPYLANPLGGALNSIGGGFGGPLGGILKQIGGGLQNFSNSTKVQLADDEKEDFLKAYTAYKTMRGK